MRRLFPQARYVSLDLPSIAASAQERPESFLESLQEPALIDEVQYAPGLFRALKAAIDRRREPGRFLLTGSQSFLLMQGVSESLAGRCAIAQLHPLSWEEARGAVAGLSVEDYLSRGGYPELYTERGITPDEWYPAYLATYLERDVRNILRVGSLRDFDRFLRAAALRTASLLSYSDLARDVGIAPNTARQWVSVLQASGMIGLLEPYHRSLGKRLVKSPKLYFADTGLAAFLLGLRGFEGISRSPVAGALWETHVINQVVRRLAASGDPEPLWYWRAAQGAEVDLLIERGGRFVAVECKLSEHPGPADLKGLRALSRFYGPRAILRSYVACRARAPYPIGPEATAVEGSSGDFPAQGLFHDPQA